MRTLGYDPGGKRLKGKNRNGVACATFETTGSLISVETDTVSDAKAALGWLAKNSGGAEAIAIDTMLAWTFGQRSLDLAIRHKYWLSSGTVQAAGSLRGAMLVNGVLVARHFGSQMRLIEVHPKAALSIVDPDVGKRYRDIKHDQTEHAADAFLGAWIAGQWQAKVWQVDLFEMLPPAPETHYPAGPAVYPWLEHVSVKTE